MNRERPAAVAGVQHSDRRQAARPRLVPV